MTGTGSRATVRHSVSSQNAHRSAMLPPPRALEPREQVALAGQPQLLDPEREARRGGGTAGVVVASAGGHHLHPVAQVVLGEPRAVEIVAPHRAGKAAVAVAQLEVDVGSAAEAHAARLAEHAHVGELAQALPQARGVAADRERTWIAVYSRRARRSAGGKRIGGHGRSRVGLRPADPAMRASAPWARSRVPRGPGRLRTARDAASRWARSDPRSPRLPAKADPPRAAADRPTR